MKFRKETTAYISKIKKQLNDKGILDEVDDMAIEMLAAAHHNYITSTEFIIENGTTYTMTTREGSFEKSYPQVKIQLDSMSLITKLLREFGATASSRKKVNAVEKTEPNSPLSEFLTPEYR